MLPRCIGTDLSSFGVLTASVRLRVVFGAFCAYRVRYRRNKSRQEPMQPFTSAFGPTPEVNRAKGDIADDMSVIGGKAEVAGADTLAIGRIFGGG